MTETTTPKYGDDQRKVGAALQFGKMNRKEVLLRAIALVPSLRSRAEQCVRDRRVCDATIDDLKRTGLLRLLQPKKYGGYEMSWDVFCEVIQILASGCGNQGWVWECGHVGKGCRL